KFVASRSPDGLAVGADRHAVVACGSLDRNITGIEVALDQIECALRRRAITAAAASLHTNKIAGRERKTLLLFDRASRAGLAAPKGEPSRLSLRSPLHAPGRKPRAVEIGL